MMRLQFAMISVLLSLATVLFMSSAAQALTTVDGSSRLDAAQGCGDANCVFDVIYTLDEAAPEDVGARRLVRREFGAE